MRSIVSQGKKSRVISFYVSNFVLAPIFAGLFLGLALFVALSPKSVLAQEIVSMSVPAPTLISITSGSRFTSSQPVVTGLTPNNTQIDVFFDGKIEGSATVRNHKSGTANFFYYPQKPLKPGSHALSVLARKDANLSQEIQVSFEIIGFVPPTILDSVFNLETLESRPFVTGVARNDSRVQIYLDNKLDGEVLVKNHISGVASFRYKPNQDLEVGMHQAYAIATNRLTGQESHKSKLFTFQVKSPYPAPTLFRPTAANASWSRPLIFGLAKNGSYVDIYINNVRHRVVLKSHESGTTSFNFRPETPLALAQNIIFAVAYSSEGRMSRKSNLVYWDLTPKEEKAEGQIETPEEAEKPDTSKAPAPAESDLEIDIKDLKETPKVKIEAEQETPTPIVAKEEKPEPKSETATTAADEEPEKEPVPADQGPNLSKVIGLIILAVLIIALIIQLLRKEEPEKKGETLDLFEDSSKKEKSKKDKQKKEKIQDNSNTSKSDDIPPPPPPSSNLPF